jgi:BMFP domain-containing protein YqiC
MDSTLNNTSWRVGQKKKATQKRVINQNAQVSKELLEYKKSVLWKSIEELKRLDREIRELEAAQ